jgi:hypothetical protein
LILNDIVKQLELFPAQKPTYSRQPSKLEMSADALYQWKQRIFEYQSAEKSQPQQQTLFELAPDTCNADTLDPFSLQLHNLSFCEQPDWGDGFKSRRTPRFKSRRTLRTCLYFAMAVAPAIAYDTAKPTPLLLYVGETERSPFTAMDEPLHRQLHRNAPALFPRCGCGYQHTRPTVRLPQECSD